MSTTIRDSPKPNTSDSNSKKRRRSTNGNSTQAAVPSGLATAGRSRTPFAGPIAVPDTTCAFCKQATKVNSWDRSESLISCAECGSSGEYEAREEGKLLDERTLALGAKLLPFD